MLIKNGFRRKLTELFLAQPARLIIASFFLLQIIGTFLLMLPAAQVKEGSLPFFQALFTSVSATCVAGLSVHDTFLYFTDFGKAVILVLLQVGALGLVTLTASFFSLLGKKGKNRAILMAQEATDVQTILKTRNPFRFILLFTLGFELFGSIIFALYFIPQYGLGRGIFYSVFHAVSSRIIIFEISKSAEKLICLKKQTPLYFIQPNILKKNLQSKRIKICICQTFFQMRKSRTANKCSYRNFPAPQIRKSSCGNRNTPFSA